MFCPFKGHCLESDTVNCNQQCVDKFRNMRNIQSPLKDREIY